MTDHHWRIIQDGLVVASGTAPSRARADIARRHYAMMYADDGGPIRHEVRLTGTRWRRPR